MGEGRELFELAVEAAEDGYESAASLGHKTESGIYAVMAVVLRAALTRQPDPVPELPEWLERDEDGDYIVHFHNGLGCVLAPHYGPEDYDRISEAARILAARERARRAGR